MLCCIFHVIRVLSVCFTHFNFVNTIGYWICIILNSEYQNKHIHSRNQYTLSKWVHQKQSFHPFQFSNSLSIHICFITTFTIVIFLFFSREKKQLISPAQYAIPNKRKWKSYLIRLKSFLGTSQIKSQSITLHHIEAFLVIRDFISSVVCFRIEKDIEALFSLHKVWISLLSHNEK